MTTLRNKALTALLAALLLVAAPIASRAAEQAAGSAAGQGASPDRQAGNQDQAGGGNKVVPGPKDQTTKDPYKLDPSKPPAKDSAKDLAKDVGKDLGKGPAKDSVKEPGKDVGKDLAGLAKGANLPKTGDQPPVQKAQDLAKPPSFGSLNIVKSLDQLFANSRGGDQQATAVLVTGGAGNPVAGGKGGAAPNQDAKPNALPQGPGTPGTSPLAPATQGVQAATPGALVGLQNAINAQRGAGSTQVELIQLQNKTNSFNKAAQDQSNTMKNLGDTARGTIQTIK